MGTKKKDYVSEGRVFLVMELEHVRQGPGAGVSILLSLPGRDDVVVRHWRAPHGVLPGHALNDLGAYAEATVRDAVISFVGYQEVLTG